MARGQFLNAKLSDERVNMCVRRAFDNGTLIIIDAGGNMQITAMRNVRKKDWLKTLPLISKAVVISFYHIFPSDELTMYEIGLNDMVADVTH